MRIGTMWSAGGRARAAGLMLAVGAVVAVSGCKDGGGSPAPVSSVTSPAAGAPQASVSTTAASNTSWNPCSIPDADIAAAGLDPTGKMADTDKYAQKFSGWDSCGWLSADWYVLDVLSTNAHTYDEVVNNTTLYRNPQPTTIAGRRATILPDAHAKDECTVSVDVPGDPVQFNISQKPSADTLGDPCAEAVRIAGVLAKDLPGGK